MIKHEKFRVKLLRMSLVLHFARKFLSKRCLRNLNSLFRKETFLNPDMCVCVRVCMLVPYFTKALHFPSCFSHRRIIYELTD